VFSEMVVGVVHLLLLDLDKERAMVTRAVMPAPAGGWLA
jgi:hypothetical protein